MFWYKKTTGVTLALTIFWATCTGTMMFFFEKYKHTAVESRPSHAEFIKNRKTNVVVVLHPKCDCSKATLFEFKKIYGHFEKNNKIDWWIIFSNPKNIVSNWNETSLYSQSKELKKAHVLIDHDNLYQKNLYALTSGETFVFNELGSLVFSGGITESRGHRGDNIGSTLVTNILSGHSIKIKSTKTFGCLLRRRE